MSSLLEGLARRAYKELVCSEIKELIDKRLSANFSSVYDELIVDRRNEVRKVIGELNIDELNLSSNDKSLVAEKLLSIDIAKLLSYKSKIESELGLKDSRECEPITNGLEFSPYFEMLGSPIHQTGFTRRINELIGICNDVEVVAALEQVRDLIVGNWKELNPTTATPNVDDYWFIRNTEVKPVIAAWLVKKQ